MLRAYSNVLAIIASSWTTNKEKEILKKGRSLNPMERMIAQKIGIEELYNIRVLEVEEITYPFNFIFKIASKFTTSIFLSPAGMALGKGILVNKKYKLDLRLISHELVHVKQYQEFGGHIPFLKEYIFQCMEYGYNNCQLELEADQFSNQPDLINIA